jgi:DNA polymerase III subunit delta'
LKPQFGNISVADDQEDPREVLWHPRFATRVVGHDQAMAQFDKAFASGRPHHAWLIHGTKGIGKATLAYALARKILGQGNPEQARRWIDAKAHPDLFVLERQLNDSKPRKLKAEISVEDARGLSNFFARTASGTWRVAIVDAADDLNTESANAILKLVEEPPANALLLLLSHQPGRLLRTLKSRCLRLGLDTIDNQQTYGIVNALPLEPKPSLEDLDRAVLQSSGSAGQVLSLLTSTGAKAFAQFANLKQPKPSEQLAIANTLGGRGVGPEEFPIFTTLLLDWVAARAKSTANKKLAEAHATISENARVAIGFNLDRKQAVMSQLQAVNDALKAQ